MRGVEGGGLAPLLVSAEDAFKAAETVLCEGRRDVEGELLCGPDGGGVLAFVVLEGRVGAFPLGCGAREEALGGAYHHIIGAAGVLGRAVGAEVRREGVGAAGLVDVAIEERVGEGAYGAEVVNSEGEESEAGIGGAVNELLGGDFAMSFAVELAACSVGVDL